MNSYIVKGLIAVLISIFSMTSFGIAAEKTGILKQTVMTNFPWFIISVETAEKNIEKFNLNIEAVGLTSDQFIALRDKKIIFTMNPTSGGFLRDVEYNGQLLYQFEKLNAEWEHSTGILHIHADNVSLEAANGKIIELGAVMLEKLSAADNQSVTAYYETWIDDNISSFGAAE